MKTKSRLASLGVLVLLITIISVVVINVSDSEKEYSEQQRVLSRRGLHQEEQEVRTEGNEDEKQKKKESNDSQLCRNTVQGKLLLADDRGYVCDRGSVEASGCCSLSSGSSERHACSACDHDKGCCQLYEHCVSCCLHPQRKAMLESLVSEARSRGNNILLSSTQSLFEVCVAQCRTNSLSVHRKNIYVDEANKYCYDHKRQLTDVH